MYGPRNVLLVIVVVLVLFAVFDRGTRFPIAYPGSLAGFIVLIVVLAWLFRWF